MTCFLFFVRVWQKNSTHLNFFYITAVAVSHTLNVILYLLMSCHFFNVKFFFIDSKVKDTNTGKHSNK